MQCCCVVRIGRGAGRVAVDGGAAAGGAAAPVLLGHAGLRLPRPHRRTLLRRQGHAGRRGQARGHGLEVSYSRGADKCFNTLPYYTGQTTTACSGAVGLAMAKTALIGAHVQTCTRPGQ